MRPRSVKPVIGFLLPLLLVSIPLWQLPTAECVVAQPPPPSTRARPLPSANRPKPKQWQQQKQQRKAKKAYDPSLEELESLTQRIGDAVAGASRRIRRLFRTNRPLLLALGGTLGLAHGASAAFTVLFVQSFGASGWPLVRKGIERGRAAYEEAKAAQPRRETAEYAAATTPLKRRLIELATQLAQLRRDGASDAAQAEVIREMRAVRRELESVPPSRRAAPVLVAACEPSVVRDVVLGIWSGVTVSLAAACSSAARTIGVGVRLGEVVADVANALLARIEPAVRRALSALPAEAVMLTYLGPSVFGSATLGVLGRSLGCWVAYRLQHLAAILSVSLLSARMLLEAIVPSEAAEEDAPAESGADAATGRRTGAANDADAADAAPGDGARRPPPPDGGGGGGAGSRALVAWARPALPRGDRGCRRTARRGATRRPRRSARRSPGCSRWRRSTRSAPRGTGCRSM